MYSPQQEIMIKALGLKIAAQQFKPSKNPKFEYTIEGFLKHRAETKKPKTVVLKRAIPIDRSRYTGEKLREIRAANGAGKGLRQLAIRDARKAFRPTQPDWMNPSLAEPVLAEAA